MHLQDSRELVYTCMRRSYQFSAYMQEHVVNCQLTD